jgi:hypothetical protein
MPGFLVFNRIVGNAPKGSKRTHARRSPATPRGLGNEGQATNVQCTARPGELAVRALGTTSSLSCQPRQPNTSRGERPAATRTRPCRLVAPIAASRLAPFGFRLWHTPSTPVGRGCSSCFARFARCQASGHSTPHGASVGCQPGSVPRPTSERGPPDRRVSNSLAGPQTQRDAS